MSRARNIRRAQQRAEDKRRKAMGIFADYPYPEDTDIELHNPGTELHGMVVKGKELNVVCERRMSELSNNPAIKQALQQKAMRDMAKQIQATMKPKTDEVPKGIGTPSE